jgi:hypothetical protein
MVVLLETVAMALELDLVRLDLRVEMVVFVTRFVRLITQGLFQLQRLEVLERLLLERSVEPVVLAA